MICHHVDLEFLYEGICTSSITVKDERENARRFQVSCRLDGDEMSRGYSSLQSSMWISRSSRSSGPSRPSWCSSKHNVECVSNMLRDLMLVARGRVVSSRYKGLSNDLCCCRQGLCRHSIATACNTGWLVAGCPLLDTPSMVWAS